FGAPVGENSLTVPALWLATYRLPAASNARPKILLSPEEAKVLTCPAESIWLTVSLPKLVTYNTWAAREEEGDSRAQAAARTSAVRIRCIIGSDLRCGWGRAGARPGRGHRGGGRGRADPPGGSSRRPRVRHPRRGDAARTIPFACQGRRA